jgi:YegS/Rv2252/BmrU family lipid kinase
VKALFIVNERSGRKRGYDIAGVIRRACPFEHEIAPCGRKEELDAMIDAAERTGVDVVFAVGGDGTVHETAKRLTGRGPALGILPTGSGNGFARHIGLPLDPAATLAACGTGRVVTIDTAMVNEHPFLGIMGVGFDAVIAERFASSTVRGLATYVKEGLRAFTSFRAEEYEIVIDGKSVRRRAFVVAVANSGQYGNNARIAPLASVQDGLLDVVILNETSLLAVPPLLARLFSGSFDRAGSVTTMRARELTIRRASAGAAHLDGEPITLPAELRVGVRPASLRVLVPNSSNLSSRA